MKKTLTIGGKTIEAQSPPFIIAEVSANHKQSLDRTLDIVKMASECGVDAIKLQTYSPDTMTLDVRNPDFCLQSGTWAGQYLYDLYKEAMMPWEFHQPVFELAEDLGLICFSTAYDLSSVDFLEKMGVPAYKVASFENNDLPLLRYIAKTGKPILISTGIANFLEIAELVSVLRSEGCDNFGLLHCISGYPSLPDEANLSTMTHMRMAFDCVVGLSDHSMDPGVSIAAVALGASIIEKHVTLRRADGGPDSTFSLEREELELLVKNCHVAHAALGKIDYDLKPTEKHTANYRRSLYVAADIKAGERFNAENIRSVRPGYGLPPKYLDVVLGRQASHDLKKGQRLTWQDIAS